MDNKTKEDLLLEVRDLTIRYGPDGGPGHAVEGLTRRLGLERKRVG